MSKEPIYLGQDQISTGSGYPGMESGYGNRLLSLISPAARSYFGTQQIIRPMSAGETLYEEGQPFTHAVFPHTGVVSLMSEMTDGRTVDKASIGNEGYIGFALMLGGGSALSRSIVRIGGAASWLPLASIDHALAEFPCIRATLMRYSGSLVTQLMNSVACNSLHSAEHRVARWLLHAHDRMNGASFQITQESISQALGIRRATAGIACASLLKAGVIDYTRGNMAILDRAGLEFRCCECYGRIRKSFDWQNGKA